MESEFKRGEVVLAVVGMNIYTVENPLRSFPHTQVS